MIQALQEYFAAPGAALRVDRPQAVLRGVKILGHESRNGRLYLPEALAGAAGLYEGTKVNVNHPKGSPLAVRDYQERIGVLRNVAAQPEEGLFADFHFNPKHALAEQLLWDAEHAPENVGFSHNVEARVSRRGERNVVEAILKVQSVDLVADPATTRGLFESAIGEGSGKAADIWSELTLETLRGARPDLVSALAAESGDELTRLRAELSRARLQEALRERRKLIGQVLAEFKLPSPDAPDLWSRAVVGGDFLESLLAAPDEVALRQLVEARANLVAEVQRGTPALPCGAKAISREQARGESLPAEFDPRRFADLLRIGA